MSAYEEDVWRVIVKLAEYHPWGMSTLTLRSVLRLGSGQPQGILRSLRSQGTVEYYRRTKTWYLTHPAAAALRYMPGIERHALKHRGSPTSSSRGASRRG